MRHAKKRRRQYKDKSSIKLPKLSPAKEIAFDFCLVFLYAAMLIRPYFRAKYQDKWSSIESTFISDARYLAENWPHPGWQPLWYTGTRFDYVYPPALRYGTAVIIELTDLHPGEGVSLLRFAILRAGNRRRLSADAGGDQIARGGVAGRAGTSLSLADFSLPAAVRRTPGCCSHSAWAYW